MTVHTPRNEWHIFVGITGMSFMGWFIHTLAPSTWYTIAGFLLIFWVTCFYLLLYLINNVRRSFILSIAITGIAALRAAGLRDFLYSALLITSLLLLNIYIIKK